MYHCINIFGPFYTNRNFVRVLFFASYRCVLGPLVAGLVNTSFLCLGASEDWQNFVFILKASHWWEILSNSLLLWNFAILSLHLMQAFSPVVQRGCS